MSYEFTYAISARRITSDRLSPSASAFARAAVQVVESTRTALAGVVAKLLVQPLRSDKPVTERAYLSEAFLLPPAVAGVVVQHVFKFESAASVGQVVSDLNKFFGGRGLDFSGFRHVPIMHRVFTIVNTGLVSA